MDQLQGFPTVLTSEVQSLQMALAWLQILGNAAIGPHQ